MRCTFLCDFAYSLVGEGCFVFFVGEECITVCDSDFVMCNNGSSLVYLFNRFEDSLVYRWWVNCQVLFFWTNIEGALCSEAVVVDDYGGCMFDAAVTGCVFAITILSFVFVIVIDTLNFFFVNITRSDMDFCLLFLVVEGAVNFLINAVILLVWLLPLIVAAFDFEFWVSSWRIWVAAAGERSSGRFMIAYVDLLL